MNDSRSNTTPGSIGDYQDKADISMRLAQCVPTSQPQQITSQKEGAPHSFQQEGK
jgi:hypothetical protein